jgi:hypothetical protein
VTAREVTTQGQLNRLSAPDLEGMLDLFLEHSDVLTIYCRFKDPPRFQMSPPILRPCVVCGRHVQAHEGAPPCPFCAATPTSSSRSFVAMVVAGASLVACQKTTPATAGGDDAMIPAAPAASSVAAAPPDAAAEQVTADLVDAGGDAGRDAGLAGVLGSGDLRVGGGGPIGPLSLRTGAAVYGPAPSDVAIDGGAPRQIGDVAVASPVVTKGALVNHERVLAGMRGRLRNCYTIGLRADPTQKGVVTLVLDVAANGEVSKAEATGPLAPEVLACMKSVGMRTVFDAPGAPAQLSTKVTCTPRP